MTFTNVSMGASVTNVNPGNNMPLPVFDINVAAQAKWIVEYHLLCSCTGPDGIFFWVTGPDMPVRVTISWQGALNPGTISQGGIVLVNGFYPDRIGQFVTTPNVLLPVKITAVVGNGNNDGPLRMKFAPRMMNQTAQVFLGSKMLAIKDE